MKDSGVASPPLGNLPSDFLVEVAELLLGPVSISLTFAGGWKGTPSDMTMECIRPLREEAVSSVSVLTRAIPVSSGLRNSLTAGNGWLPFVEPVITHSNQADLVGLCLRHSTDLNAFDGRALAREHEVIAARPLPYSLQPWIDIGKA